MFNQRLSLCLPMSYQVESTNQRPKCYLGILARASYESRVLPSGPVIDQ